MHQQHTLGTDSPSIPSTHATAETASSAPGQRHATLTLFPRSKPPGAATPGPAYQAHLQCANFAVRLDDPTVLGLIAFVVDVGTVRLQLPALPDRLPRIAADRQDLPVEVIALTTRPGGTRRVDGAQNALPEAASDGQDGVVG